MKARVCLTALLLAVTFVAAGCCAPARATLAATGPTASPPPAPSLFDGVRKFPRHRGFVLTVQKRGSSLSGYHRDPYFISVRREDGDAVVEWLAHGESTFVTVENEIIRIEFDPDGPLHDGNGVIVSVDLISGAENWRRPFPSETHDQVSGGWWRSTARIYRTDSKGVRLSVGTDPERIYKLERTSGRLTPAN